jgi:hypothetical protein
VTEGVAGLEPRQADADTSCTSMENMTVWTTIITSAAVGALVAGILTLIGQAFERSARKKDMLLAKAIELAVARREFTIRAAEQAGADAELRDDVFAAADYYRILEQIREKGQVPTWFSEREANGPVQGAPVRR